MTKLNGYEFAATLPDLPTDERDEAIYDAIVAGHAPKIEWVGVETSHGDHHGVVFVAARSFLAGDVDPLLVNVSQLTFQRLVDHLSDDGTMSEDPVYGAVMPTAKISDLIYLQAKEQLGVYTQPSDPTDRADDGYSARMDDTGAMVRHSQEVLGAIEATGASSCTLVAPMGKDWHGTNALTGNASQSAEYGLQSPTAGYQGVTPGVKVWQPAPGLFHVAGYKDYSMCPRAVRAKMLVDGKWRPVAEVAADPDLCWLVSTEGPIKSLRHPADPGTTPATPPTIRPRPLFIRTLRRGMVGEDVRVWQRVIMVTADGVFGPNTEASTKKWQSTHSWHQATGPWGKALVADGIVGPRTRAAARADFAGVTPVPGTTTAELDLGDIPFVPAVNFTRVGARKIRVIVLHSMEAPEKPSTGEAVANWFAGRSGAPPRASAHLCIDNNSVVEGVKPGDVAWACPGANHDGYQVEHAGYARQSRAEWLDDYSESMLWLSARVVRAVADAEGIPLKHLTDAELAAGDKGLIDHHQGTRVYKRSNHTDLGAHFPWDWYLTRLEEAA